MTKAQLFDGTVLEFPDGTAPEVVQRVAREQTAQRRAAQPATPTAAATPQVPALVGAGMPSGQENGALAPWAAGQPAAPGPVQGPPPLPPERGMVETVGRAIAQVPRGFREGVATLAGVPVDAINNLPRILNLARPDSVVGKMLPEGGVGPITKDPVMGSKWIDDSLGAPAYAAGTAINAATGNAGAPVDVDLKAENTPERIIRRMANEIGGAAIPAGAAIRVGGQMGAEAARNGGFISRNFLAPAAVDPAKFAAREGMAATAAGIGAGSASELFGPGAGTELGGALAGLGVYGIGGTALRAGKSLFDAALQRPGYVDQTVRDTVTGRLAQGLGAAPDVNGMIDTDPLVRMINGASNVAEREIPGFKASLADRTGSPGVANMEYGMQSHPDTAGAFGRRRAENTQAIDAELRTVEPAGTPGGLGDVLRTERGTRLSDAEAARLAAADEVGVARQPLVPTNTAEGRGADIRSALVDENGRLRDQVDMMYGQTREAAAVPVDMTPLAQRYAERDASLGRSETRNSRPVEAGDPAALSGGGQTVETGLLGPDGRPIIREVPPEPVPLSEAMGIRSSLSDDINKSVLARQGNDARIKRGYRDDTDAFIREAAPPELRQQLDDAARAHRDRLDRFERPGTAIGDTLRRSEGTDNFAMHDTSVPPRFVQPNEGRVSDFDSLMREAGTDPRARSAVEDHIRADVGARGLLDNPAGLQRYVEQHSRVLDEFPDLRRQLETAGTARGTQAEREAAQTALQRDIGTDTTPGSGPVGQYLRFGDEKAENAMRGVMANAKPREAAENLMEFAGRQPEAVQSARKIFWDIMQKDARAGGATTKTAAGDQPWNPARLKTFLDNPSNSAVAEVLYRENPEHLETIRRVSEAIQGVDVRNSAKVPNASGTAQASALLTPESLQSRFYAYSRGQVGAAYLATSIAATWARRSISRAQSAGINEMLGKALLEPDVAAQLLKENNPANRAALGKKAKLWGLNEAANMLETDEEEDQKAVIMRDRRHEGRHGAGVN